MSRRLSWSVRGRVAWPVCALWIALFCACMETRYVTQAALGQLDLWGRARPIDDVIRDPSTDERTRRLLAESIDIREFAEENGLDSQGNYRKYVQLDRGAVVWFLAAAPELSLEPETWTFPLVGSFPYLGWFDEQEARNIAARLQSQGYDVYVRRVHAYSTGGWFRDPILSSMLWSSDTAVLDLTNVLIHELTHANVLINDQSTFNESIASFVGDTMAEEYLIQRFGADAPELVVYREELAEQGVRVKRLTDVYKQLEKLYAGDLPDATKKQKKREITRAIRRELDLWREPNNASLLGFKTYNSGLDELRELYRACGGWKRFFAAVDTLDGKAFPKEQTDDIGPVIDKLRQRKCTGAVTSAAVAP